MNLYLFNPEANRGRAKKMKNKIIRYLENLGIMGEFIELKKIGEAANIAMNAIKNNVETIVIIGGDGLVNETIQVIAGEDIMLGIIPVGETNLLANILGINKWQEGCEALLNKKTIDIDLGLAGDHYFTSSVEIENKEKKEKILGIFPIKKVKKIYPVSLNIESENSKLKLQTNIYSILISTIPYPLPEKIDIEKELTDGKMHFLIKSNAAENFEKNSSPQNIKHPKNKKKKTFEEITILEGEKIEIKSKNPLLIKADGELCGETPANIKIVPKSLRVITSKRN